MNSTTLPLTVELNQIQIYITRYFLVPVYVFGNLGNIANVILFSKRKLRLNNVCAWYFIAVSLANLVGLNVGGLSRILSLLDNFTLEITSIVFCKARNYFIQSPAVIGRYFLCLISIDRWLITSSNEKMRGMSSPKFARNATIFGVSGSILFGIHILIGFEIRNGRCYAYFNDTYPVFFNVYNMTIIFLPISIMSLFTIFCLINIRQSRARVGPGSATRTSLPLYTFARPNRPRDIQFIRLSVGQILVFLIFIVTYGIYNMYDLLRTSPITTAEQQAIGSFVSGLSVNLNYVSISITFYTYTLASTTFRKEFILSARHTYRFFVRWFGF